MNCEEVRDQLHRYAAGALGRSARAALEEHVRACAACRSEAASLTPLLEHVARLPRSIQPPAEVWAGIASRVSAPRVETHRLAPSRPWWTRAPLLAAAAAALVLVSSTVTTLVMRDRGAPAGRVSEATLPGEFLALEADYARAAGEIERALENGALSITPRTREILQRNLRIMDQAINESRLALARDPANQELRDMLLSTYEHKLDLLRRVSSPSAL